MSVSFLFLIVVAAAIAWVVITYNLLVRDRNRVAQGWSDVDVQLKRRHDLIPRLVEVVKGYAGYERALLSSFTELRTRGAAEAHPGARGEVEKSVPAGQTPASMRYLMQMKYDDKCFAAAVLRAATRD